MASDTASSATREQLEALFDAAAAAVDLPLRDWAALPKGHRLAILELASKVNDIRFGTVPDDEPKR